MLQAIGLTDKQLIKMLNIEAMFYTGTMLLSSLTLGIGLDILLFMFLEKLELLMHRTHYRLFLF
ncbi:hypothetical protein Q5M85_08410 [Paraclostridium bifermentans]|nr:hypothetical protein [Paraclostridium bifermentans]